LISACAQLPSKTVDAFEGDTQALKNREPDHFFILGACIKTQPPQQEKSLISIQ